MKPATNPAFSPGRCDRAHAEIRSLSPGDTAVYNGERSQIQITGLHHEIPGCSGTPYGEIRKRFEHRGWE